MTTHFPTFRRLANIEVPLPPILPRYTSRGQRRSLLRLIAVAAERNLPLSPLLESWAADERRSGRRRLLRLAGLLKNGTPLPEAVEQVPGILRDDDILAIRFGAQSGTLAASLRALLDEPEAAPSTRPSRFQKAMIYIVSIIALGLPVVAFTQIRIYPAFNKIFDEFDLQQSPMLVTSAKLGDWFMSFWWLWLLLIIGLLWLTFTAGPGRLLRHAIMARLFRPLRELRTADVLQKLGIAAQAGRPIPGALSTLARYHFDPVMRHRLLFVRNEVEQGAEVWQSMASAGLLTPPEVQALNAAERVGNRPWTLQQLANGKRRHTSRRLGQLATLILPVIVIAMGAFVLFQAAALFQALVQLLRSLA